MHTITECPWCGKDFMYHQSDVHLIRQLTLIDEVGNNEIVDVVICQDCYEAENVALFIIEKSEHRGWENAECMAIDEFGEITVRSAMNLIEKGLIHFN